MTWQELGGVSEIFCTPDFRFAFQRVGNWWRLYGGVEGSFIREFRSFTAMSEYIMNERMKENDGR